MKTINPFQPKSGLKPTIRKISILDELPDNTAIYRDDELTLRADSQSIVGEFLLLLLDAMRQFHVQNVNRNTGNNSIALTQNSIVNIINNYHNVIDKSAPIQLKQLLEKINVSFSGNTQVLSEQNVENLISQLGEFAQKYYNIAGDKTHTATAVDITALGANSTNISNINTQKLISALKKNSDLSSISELFYSAPIFNFPSSRTINSIDSVKKIDYENINLISKHLNKNNNRYHLDITNIGSVNTSYNLQNIDKLSENYNSFNNKSNFALVKNQRKFSNSSVTEKTLDDEEFLSNPSHKNNIFYNNIDNKNSVLSAIFEKNLYPPPQNYFHYTAQNNNETINSNINNKNSETNDFNRLLENNNSYSYFERTFQNKTSIYIAHLAKILQENVTDTKSLLNKHFTDETEKIFSNYYNSNALIDSIFQDENRLNILKNNSLSEKISLVNTGASNLKITNNLQPFQNEAPYTDINNSVNNSRIILKKSNHVNNSYSFLEIPKSNKSYNYSAAINTYNIHKNSPSFTKLHDSASNNANFEISDNINDWHGQKFSEYYSNPSTTSVYSLQEGNRTATTKNSLLPKEYFINNTKNIDFRITDYLHHIQTINKYENSNSYSDKNISNLQENNLNDDYNIEKSGFSQSNNYYTNKTVNKNDKNATISRDYASQNLANQSNKNFDYVVFQFNEKNYSYKNAYNDYVSKILQNDNHSISMLNSATTTKKNNKFYSNLSIQNSTEIKKANALANEYFIENISLTNRKLVDSFSKALHNFCDTSISKNYNYFQNQNHIDIGQINDKAGLFSYPTTNLLINNHKKFHFNSDEKRKEIAEQTFKKFDNSYFNYKFFNHLYSPISTKKSIHSSPNKYDNFIIEESWLINSFDQVDTENANKIITNCNANAFVLIDTQKSNQNAKINSTANQFTTLFSSNICQKNFLTKSRNNPLFSYKYQTLKIAKNNSLKLINTQNFTNIPDKISSEKSIFADKKILQSSLKNNENEFLFFNKSDTSNFMKSADILNSINEVKTANFVDISQIYSTEQIASQNHNLQFSSKKNNAIFFENYLNFVQKKSNFKSDTNRTISTIKINTNTLSKIHNSAIEFERNNYDFIKFFNNFTEQKKNDFYKNNTENYNSISVDLQDYFFNFDYKKHYFSPKPTINQLIINGIKNKEFHAIVSDYLLSELVFNALRSDITHNVVTNSKKNFSENISTENSDSSLLAQNSLFEKSQQISLKITKYINQKLIENLHKFQPISTNLQNNFVPTSQLNSFDSNRVFKTINKLNSKYTEHLIKIIKTPLIGHFYKKDDAAINSEIVNHDNRNVNEKLTRNINHELQKNIKIYTNAIADITKNANINLSTSFTVNEQKITDLLLKIEPQNLLRSMQNVTENSRKNFILYTLNNFNFKLLRQNLNKSFFEKTDMINASFPLNLLAGNIEASSNDFSLLYKKYGIEITQVLSENLTAPQSNNTAEKQHEINEQLTLLQKSNINKSQQTISENPTFLQANNSIDNSQLLLKNATPIIEKIIKNTTEIRTNNSRNSMIIDAIKTTATRLQDKTIARFFNNRSLFNAMVYRLNISQKLLLGSNKAIPFRLQFLRENKLLNLATTTVPHKIFANISNAAINTENALRVLNSAIYSRKNSADNSQIILKKINSLPEKSVAEFAGDPFINNDEVSKTYIDNVAHLSENVSFNNAENQILLSEKDTDFQSRLNVEITNKNSENYRTINQKMLTKKLSQVNEKIRKINAADKPSLFLFQDSPITSLQEIFTDFSSITNINNNKKNDRKIVENSTLVYSSYAQKADRKDNDSSIETNKQILSNNLDDNNNLDEINNTKKSFNLTENDAEIKNFIANQINNFISENQSEIQKNVIENAYYNVEILCDMVLSRLEAHIKTESRINGR